MENHERQQGPALMQFLGDTGAQPVRDAARAMHGWLRHLAVAVFLLSGPALAQPAAPVEPAPSVSPSPAPVPPAPPPAVPSRPTVETPAVVLDGGVAETLLGKPVKGANGDDMGRVVDVMVDRAGTIRAAIVDFGGFLGVGTRKIAVDWRVLHFPASGAMDAIGADLSRDQLRTAPVYKPGEPVVIVGRADPTPAATPRPSAPPPPAARAPSASPPPPADAAAKP